MLPNSRPPIDLPPPSAPLPAGQVTAAAMAGTVLNPPHADYNQHPLLVNGLEYYVEPEEDERFHVS